MKTFNTLLKSISILLITGILFVSCSKNNNTGLDSGKFSVYITDAPGEFESVFIDIQKVEVKIDDNPSHSNNDSYGDSDDDRDDQSQSRDDYGYWTNINFTPAVIDILSLRNGVEAKLGEVSIDKGTVRKIRLTLGTRNTIVVDGKTSNLELRNETNNYLYVKLNDRHKQRGSTTSTNMASWIDFDIAKSIEEKNGVYLLRPVLRPFCNSNYGEIGGSIFPLAAKPVVRITNVAGFNGAALPNREGKFKLRGLDAGTYTVTVQGLAPYVDKVISNIVVTKGKETELGVITLTQ